jgi:Sulfatase-modifying factor enzyme 1
MSPHLFGSRLVLMVALGGCRSVPADDHKQGLVVPVEEMVHVPGGRFVVSLRNYHDDGVCNAKVARAEHDLKVTEMWTRGEIVLPEFEIDKHPISNCEYLECVNQHGCPRDTGALICAPNTHDTEFNARVSAKNALAYCEWRHERLPTLYELQAALFGGGGAGVCAPSGLSHPEPAIVGPSGAPAQMNEIEYSRSLECAAGTGAPRVARALLGLIPGCPDNIAAEDDDDFDAYFRCVRDKDDQPK